MKILLTDSDTLKIRNDISFESIAKFGNIVEYGNISRKDLLKEIVDTDILLCNKTLIDSEVIDKSKSLCYIGLFATGYNNIDIDCATTHNIVVCNAGSYSTNAVVQQVFAYILEHYTMVSKYDEFVKNGGWKESSLFCPLKFCTDELYGKTIGIIGYGSIGKAVEKAADGLGLNVVVNTRTVHENGHTKFAKLSELLAISDIVTVHCPLTKENANFMNAQAFKLMKRGAFFVNTSRGGILDEDALFNALESGHLSGAAIDVLKSEPMLKSCKLINAKNIIITPHTSWAPLTTRNRLVGIVADNIKAFLNGSTMNRVN